MWILYFGRGDRQHESKRKGGHLFIEYVDNLLRVLDILHKQQLLHSRSCGVTKFGYESSDQAICSLSCSRKNRRTNLTWNQIWICRILRLRVLPDSIWGKEITHLYVSRPGCLPPLHNRSTVPGRAIDCRIDVPILRDAPALEMTTPPRRLNLIQCTVTYYRIRLKFVVVCWYHLTCSASASSSFSEYCFVTWSYYWKSHEVLWRCHPWKCTSVLNNMPKDST